MGKDLDNNGLRLCGYDKKALGKRIRKLRLQYDISQEEFAESIDVSTNFVSELENGRKGMSLDTLCCLSKKYHISTDYILFGTQAPALTSASIEQALCCLPTEDIPAIIQYLQSLYKIRRMDEGGGFSR